MDTFMDKLAQRFTAQEMIKANAMAEVEEMNRLKAQVEEYTHCLNRMQQVCAEMEQTVETAKGKVDAAQFHADELKAQLLDIRQEMQNTGGREESGWDSGLTDQLESIKSAQETQIEGMRNAQSAQSAQIEELRSLVDGRLDEIRNIQDAQLNSVRDLQTNQMEGLKGLQDAQLDTLRNSVEDELDSIRSMIKVQIGNLKNGQDGQLDSVRAELDRQNANLDLQMADIKNNLDTQLGGLNDFVHKECVKVYRNVQAVVGEENNKQSENLDFTLKPMSKQIKKVFTVSIAALVCSVIGIVMQVLSMLHIL